MYKLFKASAYEKQERTPTLSAVQHDSARVIPVWIFDLNADDIADGYSIMPSEFPDGYDEETQYYIKTENGYEEIAWDNMEEGTAYYIFLSSARVIIRKPSGRRVVTDCKLVIKTIGEEPHQKKNTVVLVPLTRNALAECGTSIGQIQLDYALEAGGGQITTFKFFLKVEKSYIDHAVSTNERASIGQLLQILERKIAEMPTGEFDEQENIDVWDNPPLIQDW